MSKVVQAVNAMIANPDLIGNVVRSSSGEFFFTYKSKYNWSIKRSSNSGSDFFLYFYPGGSSLNDLASIDDWDNVPMVHYSTKEIGTREAAQSFAELHGLLKERLYDVNTVLDDIIKDDDIPF